MARAWLYEREATPLAAWWYPSLPVALRRARPSPRGSTDAAGAPTAPTPPLA
eukprot:CAMPEP_0184402490 /NCGR_PEP_ID=MMETSP0007-20130409/83187_1 /TAXON_ID=97485 /ORGANISM="Prymnesium parvum, Strain Texoma1" /LENGTH=51 /DNA_ID=CAMNT_0026758309 /DNA_START=259 /DNA_END=411 /DNA_ORIENTATION=+